MRKRLLFLLFMSISVLINSIFMLIFKDCISFSESSAFSALIMIFASANGLLSYFLRHKKNYLSFGTPRGGAFGPDLEFTFTEQYNREFFWQFSVYWFAIPFYVPCIFFATKPIHSLWTLVVLAVPQIVYIGYGIVNTLKDVNEYKSRKQKRDQELKEQQQREELGRFQ